MLVVIYSETLSVPHRGVLLHYSGKQTNVLLMAKSLCPYLVLLLIIAMPE